MADGGDGAAGPAVRQCPWTIDEGAGPRFWPGRRGEAYRAIPARAHPASATAQHVGDVSAAAGRWCTCCRHALVDEARRALRLVLRVVPPADHLKPEQVRWEPPRSRLETCWKCAWVCREAVNHARCIKSNEGLMRCECPCCVVHDEWQTEE